MNKFKLLAIAALMPILFTGCVSSSLINTARTNVVDAETVADGHIARSKLPSGKEAIERSQEVDAPFIVGKSVPLARNVSLPRALQKGVKTTIMFPEHWVSLTTAAERIMLATGIIVNISPDVYMDSSLLLPKRATGAQAGSAPAPMPQGMTSLPSPILSSSLIPPAPPSLGSKSQQDSAYGFEFPQIEAPLAQILDMVSTRLSIHWKYDEASNSIRLYRMVTKSWQIPVSSASNSYSTILDGTTSSSTNGNSIAAKPAVSPISSKSSDINELTSIKDSVETVMTKAGSIYSSPATGTITLTDTNDAVESADVLIEREVRILSRLVMLRFQTIQVTTADTGELGVDMSAVITKVLKNLPDITMTLGSPSSLVSSNAGALGVNIFSGAANGSTAMLKALHEIGEVHTSTELPLTTRNRHALYYNVRNVFSYVSATTPAVATTGGTGGTPGITTAQDSVGLKLMLYPTVTSKDTVMLTMSLDQSVLQSLDTFSSGVGANAQSVQLPNINGEGSGQEVPIRNGQTIILTGFDRISDQYDKRTLGNNIPLLAGGSMKANHNRTMTIVLMSVQIKDFDN